MPLSLEAKKKYFARVRRRNYIASLRLEGFDVSGMKTEGPLPSRSEVIAAYKRKASA